MVKMANLWRTSKLIVHSAFVLWIAISLNIAMQHLDDSAIAVGQQNKPTTPKTKPTQETLATLDVSGFVRNDSGESVGKVTVRVTLNTGSGRYPLDVQVTGRKFRFKIPTHPNCHTISLFAVNERGDHQAARIISSEGFRTISKRGLILRLKKATRIVKVKTTHLGKPVSNANVFFRTSSGGRMTHQTNAQGIAVFQCLPQLKLYQITAWKDKKLIGGYSLRGKPPRDPNKNEHEVKLTPTRTQRFEFVDTNGKPVANTRMRLDVGTPRPFQNMMDADEIFQVQTNAKGLVDIDWIPDLPKLTFNIVALDGIWVTSFEQRQLTAKPCHFVLKRSIKRQKIKGRLKSIDAESLGGFSIALETFQAEREHTIERLRAFTNPDGTFEAEVLPGSTYCLFVHDLNWCSKPIDMILFDPKKNKAATPELTLARGEKIQIVVTHGPDKKPLPDLMVRVKSRYLFQWNENGQERTGSSSRSKSVQTNDNGVAVLYVQPGTIEISAWSGKWDYKSRVNVRAGENKTIRIHRTKK